MAVRRRFPPVLALVLVASLLPIGADASPYLHETWTKAQSPYELEGTVVIDNREKLTIEPGVEVRTAPGAELLVSGVLHADGTEGEPITFSPQAPESTWKGISFLDGGFPNYQSSLTNVEIRDASEAVIVSEADAIISNSVFDGNEVAFRAENPQYDLSITGNTFMNNHKAITGRTRGSITISENAFWNNNTNLLPLPQAPYDCLSDAGVWNVNSNDILRGPDNAEFFSSDVHTPEGSKSSDYTVVATDNWWGTTDESHIAGRLRPEFDCCPRPPRKAITWQPIATSPRTSFTAPGEQPDPDPTFPSHADPGRPTQIGVPRHGSCYDADAFHVLKGRFLSGLGGPSKATAAVRLKRASGCMWWSNKERGLVRGPCDEQRWFRVDVDRSDLSRWRYRFRGELPAGRYTAWSFGFAEPTHVGRNRVAFTLH